MADEKVIVENVIEETVNESVVQEDDELTFEENYELAKKALVIKAYNLLVDVESFFKEIKSFVPSGEEAAQVFELIKKINSEDFSKKFVDAVIEKQTENSETEVAAE